MNHFKGKHFQKDVIIVAVSYYLRFNLSYRNIQELLSDRGIDVCYSTIQLWKRKNKSASAHWQMDETYIKVKGKWHYLY
jgi:putative transposase